MKKYLIVIVSFFALNASGQMDTVKFYKGDSLVKVILIKKVPTREPPKRPKLPPPPPPKLLREGN